MDRLAPYELKLENIFWQLKLLTFSLLMRVFVEKGGGKEDKNLMQKSLFSRRKGHQNWLTSYVNDSEPLFKVLINHKITRTCRIVGLGGTWSHFRFFGNFYHLFQFIMTPPL